MNSLGEYNATLHFNSILTLFPRPSGLQTHMNSHNNVRRKAACLIVLLLTDID